MIRDERGFTVVELLVAMVVMGIIIGGFAQMLISSSKTSNRVTEQALLQNEVRVTFDRLSTDLRSAMNANGTSPVESSSGTSLTFLSPDTGTPFHLRRIAYRFIGGSIDRSTTYSTDTDGWPWVWPAAAGAWVPQVGSITNASVFTYYDADGAPTTDPNAVRSIRISVTVAPRQQQGGQAAYSALVAIRARQ